MNVEIKAILEFLNNEALSGSLRFIFMCTIGFGFVMGILTWWGIELGVNYLKLKNKGDLYK